MNRSSYDFDYNGENTHLEEADELLFGLLHGVQIGTVDFGFLRHASSSTSYPDVGRGQRMLNPSTSLFKRRSLRRARGSSESTNLNI